MVVYITEQGAKIRREGERLIVCSGDNERILLAREVRRLLLFGNIHLTAQARSLLFAKKIDTVFLSAAGSFRGRLSGEIGENVFLRKRQYELLNDAEFQLAMAREIVRAKLRNQATMLGRIKREHNVPEAADGVEELKEHENRTRTAENTASLRGVEGAGAAAYFRYFARAFHRDHGFSGRVRRPPTDPVNAVLSLVYTLLVDRCHAACRLHGLDPFPGALHALEYGRKSLPLDLVEEFRAVIGDSLVLSLFNARVLHNDDFETAASGFDEEENFPAAEKSGLVLKKEALKKVLAAFARKMNVRFRHSRAGAEMTYSEAVDYQAGEYRRAVEGAVPVYTPLIWH